MEKSLIIKGPLRDLSDLLQISRVEARKVLGVHNVRVKPLVYPYGVDSYVVVVEPDGSGCSKASSVGSGRNQEK